MKAQGLKFFITDKDVRSIMKNGAFGSILEENRDIVGNSAVFDCTRKPR